MIAREIGDRARLAALALLVAAGPLTAQEPTETPPADSTPAAAAATALGDVAGAQVTFDVVRLYGVEGKTLIEMYSRIPTHGVTFQEVDGRWEAPLTFDLTVRDGDEVVLQDRWERTKSVADRRTLDVPRAYFVETHAFLLSPGTYQLQAVVTGAEGREIGRLDRTIEAPSEPPPVSDLLLASRIVADTASAPVEGYDPTRKNRLVLNPNPGQIYSTSVSPLVYFYYEFQNDKNEPLAVERVLRFRDSAGGIVKEVRNARTFRPGWSVDFGGINVAGLPEGSYTLQVAFEAPAGSDDLPDAFDGLSREEDFVLLRQAPMPVRTAAATPEGAAPATGPAVVNYYEGFTHAQLDSVYNILEVFFDEQDDDIWKGLTEDGKRSLLNRMWAREDATPGTPDNPFYGEVQQRLAIIDQTFSEPSQPGHRTARGRIWLRNGKPDRRVERVLESGFSAPYEVWLYYNTGYKYVFLDEFRNHRYILLVSSDPEEQGRPDWQERLPPEAVQEILRE